MSRRPVGVTVLAVLGIVYGALQLLAGLSLIGMFAFTIPGVEVAGLEALGITAGIVSLIVAALSLVFGIGALGLRRWAWTLGVVLTALMVISAVIGMFAGGTAMIGSIIAALAFAAALVYLLTDDVRTAFGHQRGVMHTGTGTPVAH